MSAVHRFGNGGQVAAIGAAAATEHGEMRQAPLQGAVFPAQFERIAVG